MHSATAPLYQSDLDGLELLSRGKVRDIYAVDGEHLLIVASDRLSAFDVVLPDPIPGKGEVLTALSRFWFERTRHIVANHLSAREVGEVVGEHAVHAALETRSLVVRRLRPLPIEAIVRGYLIGSGWKDYLSSGKVCGIALPAGLEQAARLPETLFTPSTKAEAGEHDLNISFDDAAARIGRESAGRVRDVSLRLYEEAAAHAAERGIIIADTKFEFAVDADGTLVLIDEVLTPDSSRFWPADAYRPGRSPPSFDKQFVRDHLEASGWNKRAPAPRLPESIIAATASKYAEARERLTRQEPAPQKNLARGFPHFKDRTEPQSG